MSRRRYTVVRVNDVDVDKTKSPWGYVVLNLPGKAKKKWKHFFKSHAEFKEFFALWSELKAPFLLVLIEVCDTYTPRSYWRRA